MERLVVVDANRSRVLDQGRACPSVVQSDREINIGDSHKAVVQCDIHRGRSIAERRDARDIRGVAIGEAHTRLRRRYGNGRIVQRARSAVKDFHGKLARFLRIQNAVVIAGNNAVIGRHRIKLLHAPQRKVFDHARAIRRIPGR